MHLLCHPSTMLQTTIAGCLLLKELQFYSHTQPDSDGPAQLLWSPTLRQISDMPVPTTTDRHWTSQRSTRYSLPDRRLHILPLLWIPCSNLATMDPQELVNPKKRMLREWTMAGTIAMEQVKISFLFE